MRRNVLRGEGEEGWGVKERGAKLESWMKERGNGWLWGDRKDGTRLGAAGRWTGAGRRGEGEEGEEEVEVEGGNGGEPTQPVMRLSIQVVGASPRREARDEGEEEEKVAQELGEVVSPLQRWESAKKVAAVQHHRRNSSLTVPKLPAHH